MARNILGIEATIFTQTQSQSISDYTINLCKTKVLKVNQDIRLYHIKSPSHRLVPPHQLLQVLQRVRLVPSLPPRHRGKHLHRVHVLLPLLGQKHVVHRPVHAARVVQAESVAELTTHYGWPSILLRYAVGVLTTGSGYYCFFRDCLSAWMMSSWLFR